MFPRKMRLVVPLRPSQTDVVLIDCVDDGPEYPPSLQWSWHLLTVRELFPDLTQAILLFPAWEKTVTLHSCETSNTNMSRAPKIRTCLFITNRNGSAPSVSRTKNA